jgi:hypothetical protein
MINLSLKDKLSVEDQSMLVYSFNCCCAAEYVGRTTRRLSERIKEHHPAWLGKGLIRKISSAITAHLVETNHQVDVKKSFKIIYKVQGNQPRAGQLRMLAIAESIAIRLRNPALCVQKQHVQTLSLAWPRDERFENSNSPQVSQGFQIGVDPT